MPRAVFSQAGMCGPLPLFLSERRVCRAILGDLIALDLKENDENLLCLLLTVDYEIFVLN